MVIVGEAERAFGAASLIADGETRHMGSEYRGNSEAPRLLLTFPFVSLWWRSLALPACVNRDGSHHGVGSTGAAARLAML